MTKDKVKDGKVCVTTNYLASLLGVSERTVRDWGKNGCPKAERGYWYIPDVLEWQRGIDKQKEQAKPLEEMNLETQKLFYEMQLKKAQSENHELKNAITRGDYLEKSYVVEELQRYFIIFKRSAMGLVSKIGTEVAPYLDAREARNLENNINNIVNDALEQFAVTGVYDSNKKMR